MELKEFARTMQKAEKQIRDKINSEKQKASDAQVYSSCSHLEISLDKLLENMTTESITENKQHIDNIFYHIGAIRGSL